MLKRWLDAFFPGFSWRHGFALWGVGEVIGAGASIIGGLMGDDASGDAADAQSASAAAAIEEVRKIGERTRRDTSPYRSLGANSAKTLATLLGVSDYGQYGISDLVQVDDRGNFVANEELYDISPEYRKAWNDWEAEHLAKYGVNPNLDRESILTAARNQVGRKFNLDEMNARQKAEIEGDSKYGSLLRSFSLDDLNKDVVYNKGLQFGLNEGNKAIERNATRFGNLDSGATLKALTRFGNDYGETKAAGAQNRFMGDKAFTLSSLMGGTGIGQWGVGLDASTGANMAQAIGGAQMASGNAQAAGIMGGANAWSDALGGISNMFGGGSRGNSTSWRTPPYVPQYAGGGVDLSRYYA